MIDITSIAKNLTSLEEGIWVSKEMQIVSYPDKGNADCFRVEDESFWFKHRNDCIIEAVKRFPPSGAIFDVGGGNGFVSMELKKNGYEIVLVEPGLGGARNARSRGLSPIVCSTLESAGFCEGSIPAIGVFDVLEHIKDDTAFVKQLKTLLALEGMLYITVPAHNVLWSPEDVYAGHYRRYSMRRLVDILQSRGFEVIYCTYFFCLLPIPILLFRVIPGKLGSKNRYSPESNRKEHVPNRIINKVLNIYLKGERTMLKNRGMPFGASCLVVARVKTD